MEPVDHGLRSGKRGTSLGAPMRPERVPPHRPYLGAAITVAVLAALCLPSCFTSADGRRPEGSHFFYPTGLLVSPGGTTLYVANSDFDLQFSGGSVQAIDLASGSGLRASVASIAAALGDGVSATQACATAGLGENAEPWLYPGPCSPLPIGPWVRNSALIGAFASGLLLVHRPEGEGARLFVPVRGDPSITYFEVDDDRAAGHAPSFQLHCAIDADGFCGAEHRIGQDRDRTLRGVQLPADPVGIAASPDGRAVVSAHQTEQAASLVVNDWDGTPWLSYFTSSLAAGPTEVAAVPEPALVAAARDEATQLDYDFEYRSGFLITYRSAAQIDLLHFVPDEGASPPRPFLVRAAATAITANASNFDSRGIAVIDTERRACEALCGDGANVACLWACAEVPVEVFAANRNPATLLIGELTTTVATTTVDVSGEPEPRLVPTGLTETLWFYDSVPLAIGASRVEVGHVIDADGVPAVRVFAACFDSRTLYIYDPAARHIEAVVRTGRGPHDFAIDSGVRDGEPYSYLYVGHFTDSYLGVVDLDLRRPLTYGQMFATVGVPRAPKEAQ